MRNIYNRLMPYFANTHLEYALYKMLYNGDYRITLCIALLMVLTLILLPLMYLLRRWYVRRDDVLGNFDNEAAQSYLDLFKKAPNGRTSAWQWIARLTSWMFKSTKKNAGDANVQPTALDRLREFYDHHYGRRLFAVPVTLVFTITVALLYLCWISVVEWIDTRDLTKSLLPAPAVAAILGAYMWSVNDLIFRTRTGDMSPEDLYGVAFRFLIAVPLGYSFVSVFAEDFAVAGSFLLGSFPTQTLIKLSRRLLLRRIEPAVDAVPSETHRQLMLLPSIDLRVCERLEDEGITTILQLAYADPLRLAMRTNLGFAYLMGCTSEALVWIYMGSKLETLRGFGLAGALECRNYVEYALKSGDAAEKQQAEDLLKEIAAAIGCSGSALRNVLGEISDDPYTMFQTNVW